MSGFADVLVPPNEEGTRAIVLRWCKEVGDTVLKDEPLVELETDKVTVEIPSPADGTLIEVLKEVNAEVTPDEVLARLSLGGQPTAARESSGAPPLSPAVRRLLREHSLTPADINGTGRDGRITAEDVTRHVAGGEARAAPAATPASTPLTAPLTAPAAPGQVSPPIGTRIPHTAIRRRVAEHMARSLIEAPHVTTLFEADLTRVLAHRARHAADYASRGARLTLTAYFIRACVDALRLHREVNATFHADALELHPDVNIGVGTALGRTGLIVPVIHRAQGLNLLGVAQRLGALVEAARTGKLSPEEVRGGTFTISNHGVGGSLLAAPIVINQPQVAILGVGKVERRVCAVEVDGAEAIGVRAMCYLTLTIDHRALDAFQANAFLNSVVATLEQWPIDE
ncbi:MAG TPA: 2-oxo acid dehydrogenase subunit E2 [Steroidobacteraceae bacterium]|nr:2-oxo acid dehydrogenase subunit E2 [Steroidobacteraceae bacterium]